MIMNINTDYNLNSPKITFNRKNKDNLSFKSKLLKQQIIPRIPDTIEILGQKYSTKETKNLRGILSGLITVLALPFSILGFFKPKDRDSQYKILEEDKQILPNQKVNFSFAQNVELDKSIKEGKLDKNYVEIFRKLEGCEGNDFIMKAYNLIAKSMGFDVYPELIINKDKKGSYANSDRKIIISLTDNKTKEEQLGVIRHELEHYRQALMIYKAFGREEYTNSLVQNYITKLKYCDGYCRQYFNKIYPQLSQEEIQEFAERVKREVYPSNSFEKLEYMSKRMQVIQPNTKEYEEAEKYLNAQRDYITINMFVMHPPITTEQIDYIADNEPEKFKALYDALEGNLSNELEKGAIKEQNKIKEMYELYKEIIKENSM